MRNSFLPLRGAKRRGDPAEAAIGGEIDSFRARQHFCRIATPASPSRNDGFSIKAIIIFVSLIVILSFASPLKADEATESRARVLYHDLRCMVCGGQSLAESNAELAIGMRQMILERLENGESEEQIKSYLTGKYGDEILMSPPVRKGTMFIWLMPLLLLVGGIAVMFSLRRKRHV